MEANKSRSFFVPMLIVGTVLVVLVFLTLVPAVTCEPCEGKGVLGTSTYALNTLRRGDLIIEVPPTSWSDCSSCSGRGGFPVFRLWGNK